jgi:hypothetical protein
VNDSRVYSFLEEIYALPKGNPIFSFETGTDLTTVLREQLAGLFQRLLVEDSNKIQTSLTHELQRSLQTVDQLVKFLTDEKTKGGTAVQEILFSNHPLFESVRGLTRTKYRVYFTNLIEFNSWLDASRGFTPIEETEWDDPGFMEWVRDISGKNKKEIELLWVKKELFLEDGQLKPLSPASWKDDWVRIERRETSKISNFDEDIPF